VTTDSSAPRPRRKRTRLLVFIAAGVALFGALLMPVPYVILSPGPVFNTLGEFGGEDILAISGTTTYPPTGQLDMTTVRERGGPYGPLTALEAVLAALGSRSRVVPEELVFPPGVTSQESRERGAAEFTAAQSNAVAAALGSLDIPVSEEALVAQVDSDGSAAGVLEIGDVIVTISGAQVTSTEQVVNTVRATPPGSTLDVVVRRDGQDTQLALPVGESPEEPGQGRIGVLLRSVYEGPFPIEFSLGGIGGPSAGMMFALAIIDELTPGDLTGGTTIAGTGTIDPQGNVGAIGGIQQKMIGAREAGATLFLAPESNCDAVTGAVPNGLTVAAVSTLQDAQDAIVEFSEGRTPRACPVPDDAGDQTAAPA
jgi:Lon-like protease